MAIADEHDPLEVAGVVCVSYPLHPPKKPEQLRTGHLPRLHSQSLFISGTPCLTSGGVYFATKSASGEIY